MKKLILLFILGSTISSYAQKISNSSALQRESFFEDTRPIIEVKSPNENTAQMAGGYIITADSLLPVSGIVKSQNPIKELSLNGFPVIYNQETGKFDGQFPLTVSNQKQTIILRAVDERNYVSSYELFVRRKTREKRIALVIGNASYEKNAKLRNPVNDAKAMKKALEELDFDVTLLEDATEDVLEDGIADFYYQIEDADVVMIYYSGHGVEASNDGSIENYLLPVDFDLERGVLKGDAVAVKSQIIDEIRRYNKDALLIFILDACRNNPFYRGEKGSGGGGLGRLEPPEGALIAYATGPGQVALDGDGNLSVFTEELVKQMLKPHRLEDIFIETRRNVRAKTKDFQIPWEQSNLNSIYSLVN